MTRRWNVQQFPYQICANTWWVRWDCVKMALASIPPRKPFFIRSCMLNICVCFSLLDCGIAHSPLATGILKIHTSAWNNIWMQRDWKQSMTGRCRLTYRGRVLAPAGAPGGGPNPPALATTNINHFLRFGKIWKDLTLILFVITLYKDASQVMDNAGDTPVCCLRVNKKIRTKGIRFPKQRLLCIKKPNQVLNSFSSKRIKAHASPKLAN